MAHVGTCSGRALQARSGAFWRVLPTGGAESLAAVGVAEPCAQHAASTVRRACVP